MKTESAALLLCVTFPINQLLSEPGEWHCTAWCRNRNCLLRALKLHVNCKYDTYIRTYYLLWGMHANSITLKHKNTQTVGWFSCWIIMMAFHHVAWYKGQKKISWKMKRRYLQDNSYILSPNVGIYISTASKGKKTNIEIYKCIQISNNVNTNL